jgi:hypothetical protein
MLLLEHQRLTLDSVHCNAVFFHETNWTFVTSFRPQRATFRQLARNQRIAVTNTLDIVMLRIASISVTLFSMDEGASAALSTTNQSIVCLSSEQSATDNARDFS